MSMHCPHLPIPPAQGHESPLERTRSFLTFMLHHYLLQAKAQKCWPGKCSQSDVPVLLKCISYLSHFLLCMESAK